MQVVLLAAGMGLRLGPLTRTTPKAMVTLEGRPLIDYSLPHLLSNKRVREVIVVGGFGFETLHNHVTENYKAFGDRIRLVQNKDFTKGNLYTMGQSLSFLEESFLVCNVDHLFTPETWRFILQERDQISIFCDFLRDFQEDEMKVLLDESKNLVNMSKKLEEYDGAYVGLTYVPALEREAYLKAYAKVSEEIGDLAVVENILPKLAQFGHEIQVIPFDRHSWCEVDTREDLSNARMALNDWSESAREEISWL